MLPRTARLSRDAVTALATDSRASRAKSEHFSIVFDRAAAVSGCAVVVSKKVAKTSVARHLLKRRIKSVLRDWNSANLGIIVYAREGSPLLPFPKLAAELTALLSARISPTTYS